MSLRIKTEDGDIVVADVGGGGDFIKTPQTAEVGQILMVKAVDSNGKPSEWITVDMGSRYSMTLDSDTATLNIRTLDGDT